VVEVVVPEPPAVGAVVVVVVGVPTGGFVGGAVSLAGLDGVGVLTGLMTVGLARM
jgi:hypothetical protein